jgi:hypothetical protein
MSGTHLGNAASLRDDAGTLGFDGGLLKYVRQFSITVITGEPRQHPGRFGDERRDVARPILAVAWRHAFSGHGCRTPARRRPRPQGAKAAIILRQPEKICTGPRTFYFFMF